MEFVKYIFLFVSLLAVLPIIKCSLKTQPYTLIVYMSFAFLFVIIPTINSFLFETSIGVREPITDPAVYYFYIIDVLLILVTFFIFQITFTFKTSEISRYQKVITSNRAGMLLVSLTCLGPSLIVYGMGMSVAQIMVASRFEWFSSPSFNPVALNLGFYLSVLGVIPIAYFYSIPNRFKLIKLGLLCLFVFLLVLTSARKWLLVYGIGVAVGMLFKRRNAVGNSFQIYLVFISMVLLVVLMQVFRRYSLMHGFDAALEDLSHNFIELFERGDISYFYRASLNAIELNYREDLYYLLHPIRTLLFIFIPDEYSAGLKLKSVEFLFSQDLGIDGKNRNANQPPGLIGYFVLSFGLVVSPFILAFLMFFGSRLIDYLYCRRTDLFSLAIQSTFLYCWVLLLRGSSSSVYHFVFNVLVTLLLYFVIRVSRKNSS